MKKKIFITLAFIAFTGITCELIAQETVALKTVGYQFLLIPSAYMA